MDESGDKSVKLPTFSGKQEDFQIWWTCFMAYAVVYKFKEALKQGGEDDLPTGEDDTIDETMDAGKKQALAKKRNVVAMANFSMGFTMEATMGILYRVMTPNWPSGLAYKVVEELKKKYQPQDTIS